jgi:nucleoside-diphosphate-sugar epimerase
VAICLYARSLLDTEPEFSLNEKSAFRSALKLAIGKPLLLGRLCGIQFATSTKFMSTTVADISAAQTALGYEPIVDLEEGLTAYLNWTREDKI